MKDKEWYNRVTENDGMADKLYARYEEAKDKFTSFANAPKEYQVVGQYYHKFAELQIEMMEIQTEAVGLLLKQMKKLAVK